MRAVAHRRLGPISSASISTALRFSPSWLSQARYCSRPDTTTRVPRVSVSATFSARLRQQFTEKYDASPSFHPPAPSGIRRFTAIRNLHTAAPFGV